MQLHHVSCSPSKILYVGFSPVRLQTGIQLRPSLENARIKCEAHMHHALSNLYATEAAALCSYGPIGHVKRRKLAAARQSRGPWLSGGVLCCHTRSWLTMASSESVCLPMPYFLRPLDLCPTASYGLVPTDSPICSAYL
jgi:hypothetical protein